MEEKKNKKYDLERRRPLFFGIGMIISISLALVAFEWKSPIDPIDVYSATNTEFDDYVPPITINTPPPPPPPTPKSIIIEEVTEEVDENIEVLIDQNILETDPIEFIPPPSAPKEEPEEAIRSFAEEMPSFEGGMDAFYSYLSRKIRYPRSAQQMGIEGKVFVQFIVEKDGSLSDIRVLKGIGMGCDEEALRVMSQVPQFIPGKQGDVRVRVKMIIPIFFKLQ
ncbi:MAG: energy transducer TonB [Ekhidna sp.]